jgi:o-succinylbenzoate synthase
LSQRWRDIGSQSTVQLRAVELSMVELPFVHPVATAVGVHRNRPLVLVKVVGEAGGAIIEGWGECAALGDTTYDAEDVAVSFGALEGTLVPALLALVGGTGHLLAPPSSLEAVRRAAPDAPLAFAALEMAVADAHLRAEDRSLAGLLGVEDHRVDLGAVVGVLPSIDALVDRVKGLADEGFTRVKMKIGPGWDVDPLVAVSRAVPGLRLQADANGSYVEDDATHLRELDRFELLCLEQPFERRDLSAHARLAARMATPICLDEGLSSPTTVRTALAMGACSVVCVKPARLGGLGAALEVIEWCAQSAVPLWMGGMFESGYARGVNTALAALPGFSWPGDLSPARSYLDDDLVPAPAVARAGPSGSLRAAPPPGPGMGPPPGAEALEQYTVDRRRIEAPPP